MLNMSDCPGEKLFRCRVEASLVVLKFEIVEIKFMKY